MISLQVGKHEKHTISIDYGTFTGLLTVMVDGKEYSKSRAVLTGHIPFFVNVGEKEKHEVRIELDNPLFFAFRGSDITVFVDKEKTGNYHIGASLSIFVVLMIFIVVIFFMFFLGFFTNFTSH